MQRNPLTSKDIQSHGCPAMSWQEEAWSRDYCAISTPVWAASNATEQRGMQPSPWTGKPEAAPLHPKPSLPPATFYNNLLKPLYNARSVGVSMKLLRSCAPRIPRCAALCAYAEQPCNHFCGDRQKWRQCGDGGYHEKLKGNELDRDSSISPTFYLGYMARMTSNVKHKTCAFPYHSRQQLFTTESLFIYFSND